jgi:ALG3 protein
VPIDHPVTALRLTFYLGGLACFGVPPVCEHLHLPRDSLVTSASLIAGLIFFFLACRATTPHLLRWLLPYSRGLAVCGLVGALWLSVYSLDDIAHFHRDLGRPNRSWTDAIAMTDCATHLVLRGRNPYSAFSLVDCFSRLHLDGRFSTPLQAGAFARVRAHLSLRDELRAFKTARRHHVRHPAAFESYLSYPAGAFLLAAPVVAVGWPEFSASYMVWIVGAYLLLAWRAPARMRPWLVPLALGNVAFWDYVMRGFTEGSMVFLLLAAWITRRRPVVSAVLMGAAVATHQEAWLVAPFYLVLVGHTDGWRAAVWRLAVIGAIFALVNGPFALQSPGDWLSGVLGPLKDPMFPAGAGIIALGRHGLPTLWLHPVYTVLELAALVACVLYYARTCGRQPDTGLVLALVPLVFAWRSFFVYFFAPLPILCLWPLLADLRRAEAREGGARSGLPPTPRSV